MGVKQLGNLVGDALKNTGNIDEAINIAQGVHSVANAYTTINIIGKATGILDAGIAAYDAVNILRNRNSTTEQQVGAVLNATFKISMIFVRTTPVVGLALGVLDLSGFTLDTSKW